MEKDFQKGASDNLPKIDAAMMAIYFKDNVDFTSAEIRGVKAARATRESYGDNAIGYVQVKREGDICIVKARVTPEHRVSKKGYFLTLKCDEKASKVLTIQCEGCAAGLGGCKHSVAFLAWLHRRSEDAPVTSVKCYWKKSALSAVGNTKKFVCATDLGRKNQKELPPIDTNHLANFLEMCKEKEVRNIQLPNMFLTPPDVATSSIHFLHVEYGKITGGVMGSAQDFIGYMKSKLTPELCGAAEKETKNQANSHLWHELRYGRITASKAYAAANCKTFDGSLVETIFGASFKPTNAMKRGVLLESEVVKVLQKKGIHIKKCGFYLSKENPVFGASPDAIAPDFVVEIKCPISKETKESYLKGDLLGKKHFCQIQIQMHLTEKKKGLFCIAEPDFEQTKSITETWVDYDEAYCKEIVEKCIDFWSKAVYTRLNAI